MNTREYVKYAKYAGAAGVVMFVVGALGEIIGNLILTDLPPVVDSAFIYLLALGFVLVFGAVLAGGILPLAME